jgi:flagellar basal-body rod protein FlgF/flagellar basal-body rod protein FlgG
MGSGYYAAGSALMARVHELDLIAENLANVSTPGYRAEQETFKAVLADSNSSTNLERAINNYGVLGGGSLDLSQGAFEKTGNQLDLALRGPGFFVVQTPRGDVYTRDGNFQISAKHQLITTFGDPVLGVKGPITLQPGPVSISDDGTISSAGAISGKLRIVEFPAGTQIQSMGNTYYSAPAKAAKPAAASHVRQGYLESSNVNPIQAMVQLVTAQRSADMMQRALALFNLHMDKTAPQDLHKVG